MKNFMSWIKESNRPKHLAVGLLIGLLFGFVTAVVAGASVEYKDWKHAGAKGGRFGYLKGNGFDYLDLAATSLGGLIGGAIHYILWGTL